jgi:hypothetical protein
MNKILGDMISFFKYFYFRLYTSNLKREGINDLLQFNSMLIISFLMFLNLITIVEGIELIIGKSLSNIYGNNLLKVLVIFIGIEIAIVNYFFMVNKNKYLKIAEEFKTESKQMRRKGTIIIWIYLILSFGIPITLVILYSRIYH